MIFKFISIISFIYILGLWLSILDRKKYSKLNIQSKWINFDKDIVKKIQDVTGKKIAFIEDNQFVLISRLEEIDDLVRISFKLKLSKIGNIEVKNIYLIISNYKNIEHGIYDYKEFVFSVADFESEWKDFIKNLKNKPVKS